MKTSILILSVLALTGCGEGSGDDPAGTICERSCRLRFECESDRDGPGQMREYLGKCTEECDSVGRRNPELLACYDMITTCEHFDGAAPAGYFECIEAAQDSTF